MKRLALLLFMVSFMASAQLPYTNRPDLVRPLLDKFRVEALERGLEVKERLADLDSILVIKQPYNLRGEESDGIYWTQGRIKWIEIKEARLQESGSDLRVFNHELGHHFGLEDCFACRYNIMRGQMDERANYLWKDEILIPIYMDAFYEAIRNPKKWNEGHTHY